MNCVSCNKRIEAEKLFIEISGGGRKSPVTNRIQKRGRQHWISYKCVVWSSSCLDQAIRWMRWQNLGEIIYVWLISKWEKAYLLYGNSHWDFEVPILKTKEPKKKYTNTKHAKYSHISILTKKKYYSNYVEYFVWCWVSSHKSNWFIYSQYFILLRTKY